MLYVLLTFSFVLYCLNVIHIFLSIHCESIVRRTHHNISYASMREYYDNILNIVIKLIFKCR